MRILYQCNLLKCFTERYFFIGIEYFLFEK